MAQAPALAQAPAGPSETSGEPWDRLMGLLRDIRAELQNLLKLAGKLGEDLQPKEGPVEEARRTARVQHTRDSIRVNGAVVDERLRSLRAFFDNHWEYYGWIADEATHIENSWEQADLALKRLLDGTTDLESAQLDLAVVREQLASIVLRVGFLTVPWRANEHLKGLRVGQPFYFHEAFVDEVEKEEDRKKILRFMRSQPTTVEGVVDVERGVIIRIGTAWRRTATYIAITALLVLCGVAAFISPQVDDWLKLEGWPVEGAPATLLATYVFIVLGAAAHIGVDALKQARSGEQPFVALDDWLLWVHVKETAILVAVLSLLLGFIGLAWAKQTGWETAFFVGYSIDSFVDVFLQRFAGAAKARTEAVTATLAPATS